MIQVETLERFDFLGTEDSFRLAVMALPTLRRLNIGSDRYYTLQKASGERAFYPSVTTVIKNGGPEGYALKKWRAEQGPAAELISRAAADRGTFIHKCVSKYIHCAANGQTINCSDIYEMAESDIKNARIPDSLASAAEWYEFGMKSILSFAKFCEDREVTVHATELMLSSDRLGVAGCLDILCTLRAPKKRAKTRYDGDMVLCVLDIKSGKNFYEEHEYQLAVYRTMLLESGLDTYFKDENGEKLRLVVMNWRPKDWEKEPTYELVDQTGSKVFNFFDNEVRYSTRLRAGRMNMVSNPNKKVFLFENIDPTQPVDSSYQILDLSEYIDSYDQNNSADLTPSES
jgi:hypothetical protein